MSSFKPEFKGPIEGWVVNHVHKNFWRVERTTERADLMQDAYVVFLRLQARYTEVTEPKHFMALYKSAWSNHFTDLANADTEARVLTQLKTRTSEGEEIDLELQGDTDNDGALSTMLRQAPREVTMVLNLFLAAPQEILDLALSSWNGPDRRCRAGGSERINKLLGLPLHLDTLQLVHDYFH